MFFILGGGQGGCLGATLGDNTIHTAQDLTAASRRRLHACTSVGRQCVTRVVLPPASLCPPTPPPAMPPAGYLTVGDQLLTSNSLRSSACPVCRGTVRIRSTLPPPPLVGHVRARLDLPVPCRMSSGVDDSAARTSSTLMHGAGSRRPLCARPRTPPCMHTPRCLQVACSCGRKGAAPTPPAPAVTCPPPRPCCHICPPPRPGLA